MPKPFSMDLRQRILDDVIAGMTYAETARKYSVSAEFIRRFYARYQTSQEVALRPPIRRVVPFHQRHETEIRAAMTKNPGLTLEQLRVELGLEVSIGTLWHTLQQLKQTFKKNAPRRRATATRCRPPASRVRLLPQGGHRPTQIDFFSTKPG